ncbi:hypothetical protein HDV00_010952 [Rhizophlyctis rosea]|nr:hypothetical protein HDV00_010952 [Rhizophlyctis rosea]
MEQDLNTVLNEGSGAPADHNDNNNTTTAMTDVHYENDANRDSRDVKERAAANGSRRSRSPGGYAGRSARPYDRPAGGDPYAAAPSKYSAGPRRDPSRPSRRECRVYVGNLAYEVGWQDLKDFMRKAGDVVFADILTQVGGRSKGCGVVEFAAPEEAQRAIRELSDTPFMGRPVFIREDREQEAKFGSGPGRAGPPSRGGPPPGAGYGGGGYGGEGKQIFVGNLPYIIAWQDLKDLFRQAGAVVRADIHEGPDKRSKGTGVRAVQFGLSMEAELTATVPPTRATTLLVVGTANPLLVAVGATVMPVDTSTGATAGTVAGTITGMADMGMAGTGVTRIIMAGGAGMVMLGVMVDLRPVEGMKRTLLRRRREGRRMGVVVRVVVVRVRVGGRGVRGMVLRGVRVRGAGGRGAGDRGRCGPFGGAGGAGKAG